jgi:hypothetical protein
VGAGQAEFLPFAAGQFDGAAEVAGQQATQTVGEFGDDGFAGSDIIVLFQKGVAPEVDTSQDFRHVGSVIARREPIA